MKRLAIVGLMALAGCAEPVERRGVATTVYPLTLIVSEIVGPSVAVETVLPAGVSPHAFEPLPSTVRSVGTAHVLIAMTPEVDGWGASLADTPVHWLLDPEGDPHGWLDPLTVRMALPGLVSVLCDVPEVTCSDARDRAHALAESLGDLANELRPMVAGTEVVVASDFLSAYIRRFGLNVAHVVSPVEGVEPSPAAMQAAIEAARSTRLVVGQSRLGEIAARRVAEAAGAAYVEVDPIGIPDSIHSYVDLITALTHSFPE